MKLRILFCCFFLAFISSCGTKKKVVNTKNPGVVIIEPVPLELPSVNEIELTEKLYKKNPKLNKYTLAYIRKYAPIAVKEMHEYKIPASITLAQGILESGKGRSVLALKSNNHFGIKCHTQWRGERVYHDDDEKGECFRKYNYPETSYADHSLFLTQRKRYAFLFKYDIKEYKKWAYGLKKAGYATDKRYPVKLIKIIKDYKLHEFDAIKKGSYSRKIEELNDGDVYEAPTIIKKIESNYYTVKKGDTLYSIAKAYNISVEDLKSINGLENNTISIDLQLLVKK